jgi:hypothetical protein
MEPSKMPEPISQTFFLEVTAQLEDRIDAGHNRVRDSLTSLQGEVRAVREQVIELVVERKLEKESQAKEKQAQRDRVTVLSAITSIFVTALLFLFKTILHL